MSLEKRAQALLDLIEGDRREGCADVLGSGEREGATIVRTARAQARQRVRETLAAERARLRDRLGAADARLANEQRQHDQRRSLALLAAAWDRLPQELERRWADAAGRSRWVRHVVDASLRMLPGTQWSVAHAPGLTKDECAALAARLGGAGSDRAPAIVEDASLRAGLKLRSGANLVDGSLEGLLEERSLVEALLLDRLEGAP